MEKSRWMYQVWFGPGHCNLLPFSNQYADRGPSKVLYCIILLFWLEILLRHSLITTMILNLLDYVIPAFLVVQKL
jgi:hypothetical protein